MDWLRGLVGRPRKRDDLVAFYDAGAKRIIHLPAKELAPGCVRTQMQGVEEPVWVVADDLQMGPLRHPPFDAEVREYVRRVQEAFAEHRSLTVEEWEDGFRRDLNPSQELALWIHAGNVYSFFTASEANAARRKHVYQVIVGCLTASPDTVQRVLPPGPLSGAEVEAVLRRFFPRSEKTVE